MEAQNVFNYKNTQKIVGRIIRGLRRFFFISATLFQFSRFSGRKAVMRIGYILKIASPGAISIGYKAL